MHTKIISHHRPKTSAYRTKRGDTIIEVMFAIAVFSLVAVLTVSMMNLGTANAEGALELTTARHELNAQAEALRFVHSAYTAELGLPSCGTEAAKDGKCQHYKDLWEAITKNAREPQTDANDPQQYLIDIANTLNNNGLNKFGKAVGCDRAYERVFGEHSLLTANKAFVLNIRDLTVSLNSDNNALINPERAYIPATDNSNNKFTPAPLGARIVYSLKDETSSPTTEDGYAAHNNYSQVAKVEGIWAVAIQGKPESGASVVPFYDFYIQTCWNAPNSLSPTILDTVIRLYNPGAK